MPTLSKRSADSAVSVLEVKRKEVEEQIASLDQELQKPEALELQGKIEKKETLAKELREIDVGISEIRSVQEKPVKTGGGCSG